MSDSEGDYDMECYSDISEDMSDSEGDYDMECYSDISSDIIIEAEDDQKEACLKTASEITVDAASRIAALKEKKFTKPNPWAYLMPFTPDVEADEWLNENILNLSACILIGDTSSAMTKQLDILNNYIGKYGLRFKKEQHCKMIRMIYGLVVRPKGSSSVVHSAAGVFVRLVKGSGLSRSDLLLDWLPMFNQYERVVLGKENNITEVGIQSAVLAAADFYEKGAEKDIWKRIRIHIGPATMHLAAKFVSFCMPSKGFAKGDLDREKDDVIDDNFLSVLWHFYEKQEINDYWTENVIHFFARLTKDSPSAVLPFFHQHIDIIFTRLIRALGLTAREGKVYVALESSNNTYFYHYKRYGKWIGYLLGTHESVETYLLRLLSIVQSHTHPSRNESTNITSSLVPHLILQIGTVIIKRNRKMLGHRKSSKAEKAPISDTTITAFVKASLSILIPGLHGDRTSAAAVYVLGEQLAVLRPGLVIPKILDQFYSSLSALCEPERLTNSLTILKRMLILIASDRVEGDGNPDLRQPTKKDWLQEMDNENDRLTIEDMRRNKQRKRKPQNSSKVNSSSERGGALLSKDSMRSEKSDSELLLSLRPHLVYIAEALIECIDVNDTNKTTLATDVFSLLFVLMPIVTCTDEEIIQINGCSKEDRRLFELSKRMKDIILKFLEKTFAIIDALSTNASSATGLDSVGGVKDAEAYNKKGTEETLMENQLLHTIDKLLSHADDEMGKLLCDKILLFARTSLLDNSTAAGIVRGLLLNCALYQPDCVPNFIKYITHEIEDVVDEDTKSAEGVNGQAAWLASIAHGFCFLQRQSLHDHFEALLDMGKRLLECSNKVLYQAGVWCFCNMLMSLLGTAPRTMSSSDRKYQTMWGETVNAFRTKHQWIKPVKADFEAAEKILEVSLFAEMRRLTEPEGLSREQLRKSTMIISNLFPYTLEFAPMPQGDPAPIHPMCSNGLPRPQRPTMQAFRQLADGEISYGGNNLRLALFEIVEGLITRDNCQDSQVLESLVALLPNLEQVGIFRLFNYSNVIMQMLYNPMLKARAMTPTAIFNKLISTYNTEPASRDFDASTFECRLMRTLFKLSFSLYDTVRNAARLNLANLLARYPETTLVDEFIDEITVAISDESKPEIVKAGLQLLVALGWPASNNVEVRTKIWPLLLKYRRPEDTEQLVLLDSCYSQVQGRVTYQKKAEAHTEAYLNIVTDLLNETPGAGAWKNVEDRTKLLETSRAIRKERSENINKMYTELSATLHAARRAISTASDKTKEGLVENAQDETANEVIEEVQKEVKENEELEDNVEDDKENEESDGSKVTDASSLDPTTFHLRTSDLCIRMITLVEAEQVTLQAMKEIILPRLLEERIEQRAAAINSLVYWLQSNKPKTAREQWTCPPKVHDKNGKITCGLRSDNIDQVYDSHSLPDTEEKWNNTRFFSKTMGHFAWPVDRTISLAAREAIPLGRELTDVDQAIIHWFSQRENVNQLLELTLMHLGESGAQYETDLLNAIYYVLRNYPSAAAELLNPLREALERLLEGKHVHQGAEDKAEINLELATQRLSAQLFLSVAAGTKYLPFTVLDELWNTYRLLIISNAHYFMWLAPTVVEHLDRLNFQATSFWTTSFQILFTNTDARRFWWLIEALVSSFDTTKTITADERWKPANRLSLLILSCWRSSETLNRLLSIAFVQMVSISTSDAMRKAISGLIAFAVSISTHNTDLSGDVPKRLHIRSVDEFVLQLAQKANKMSRQTSALLHITFEAYTKKEEEEEVEGKENIPANKPVRSLKMTMNDIKEKIKQLVRPVKTSPKKNSRALDKSNTTAPTIKKISQECKGIAVENSGEDQKESAYARLLIEIVLICYGISHQPVTEGMFKVLPLLCELAIEKQDEEADTDVNYDLHTEADSLAQLNLPCAPLNEQRLLRTVEILEVILKESSVSTQRETAIKFLHVMVNSNIFLFDRMGEEMRERVRSVVLAALLDKELSIRREAGLCLSAFLHVEYFELNEPLESHLRSLLSSPAPFSKQAACLGFSAIVRAFPDHLSSKVVPALRELCRISSGAAKDVLVQHWATNALRDFRASHRDDWSSDAAAVIGEDLMFMIDNELSPPYYV